jgi:hypothetical protein
MYGEIHIIRIIPKSTLALLSICERAEGSPLTLHSVSLPSIKGTGQGLYLILCESLGIAERVSLWEINNFLEQSTGWNCTFVNMLKSLIR